MEKTDHEKTHLRSKESERYNASLISSLEILDFLGTVERSASLAEIRHTLKLNKSRVMRLCGTLEHMGYLVYDPEQEVYSLGPRLMSLGKVYERQTSVLHVIRPVLQHIVDQLGETASFHVQRGDCRLCLCAVESPHQVRYIMKEGSEGHWPFGSIWKVIMAFGAAELRERILSEAPFVPETPYSAVTHQDIESVVEQTAELGYCLTNGDHDVGSSAIALPVFDSDGTLKGVLCISGITERMNAAFNERAIPFLKEQARRLSAILEGRPIRV